MVCAPVRRHNARALASGILIVQADKSYSYLTPMISSVYLARYGVYDAKYLGIWGSWYKKIKKECLWDITKVQKELLLALTSASVSASAGITLNFWLRFFKTHSSLMH